MVIKEYKYKLSDLNFSQIDLIRDLGYSSKTIPNKILDQVSELYPLIEDHVAINAGFEIEFESHFELFNDKIAFKSTEFNVGPILAKQLYGSEALVIFAATAGELVTDWYQCANAKGDLLQAFIIDTIGSCIAEAAGEKLEQDILLELKNLDKLNCPITNRFSPGYCGWDVTEQHRLFAQLPIGFCGIQLSESSIMKPQKSISGIIGFGVEVKKQSYPCSGCTYENCYKRYR